MRFRLITLCLITAVAFAVPGFCQIYKYVDENGQQRWTDDLSQVPKDQRPSAYRFESIETAPEGNESATQPPAQQMATPATEPPKSPAAQVLEREALEAEKLALDAEYQQLIETRRKIDEMRNQRLSPQDQASLNQDINEFNEKTEAYEARANAFREKVNAYNEQMTAGAKPGTN